MVCRRKIVPLSIVSMVCGLALSAILSPAAFAQLLTFSKPELIAYTPQNPFDRLPDGRPKVPDDLIERARGLSSEEVWAVLQQKQFNNQYADGFQVLHPGKTMVCRAFTVQFMPSRADVYGNALRSRRRRSRRRIFYSASVCAGSPRPRRRNSYPRRVDEEEIRRREIQVE